MPNLVLSNIQLPERAPAVVVKMHRFRNETVALAGRANNIQLLERAVMKLSIRAPYTVLIVPKQRLLPGQNYAEKVLQQASSQTVRWRIGTNLTC